jgi:predicted HAD superfamily phosphohydrolase YqeG
MDAQSPRHTPSGAMIVEALQMFQTSAPHTLMVGDHHHDEVLINRLAAHPSRTAQPHPRSASCWGRCLGRP